MGLVQTAAPASEPITLTEAKLHLRVDTSADDALITSLIEAARQAAESFCARQFVTATWQYTLDAFPEDDTINLPRPPLQSVTTLKYVDTAGATQTLSASKYTVDTSKFVGRIVPAYGESWPSTYGHIEDVEVTYVAGYGAAAAVPEAIKAAIKLLVADMYEHREAGTEGRVESNPTVERLLWAYRVLELH